MWGLEGWNFFGLNMGAVKKPDRAHAYQGHQEGNHPADERNGGNEGIYQNTGAERPPVAVCSLREGAFHQKAAKQESNDDFAAQRDEESEGCDHNGEERKADTRHQITEAAQG